MQIDRRRLLLGSLSVAALSNPAVAAPLAAQGLDAAQFGLRPGAPDDQSARLQRALDQAARAQAPLWLAPGVYRAGGLKLAAGAQLFGVRGATRLVLTRGPSLLSAQGADAVTLSGLTLEGGGQPLQQGSGLVHFIAAKELRIADCSFIDAGGNALSLAQCEGEISRNIMTGAADNALFSIDSTGLVIAGNTIRNSGNGGIRVWQSEKRHDGSVIADNTIEDTQARAGGSGQNGNAVNMYRAGGVIVRNNVIRRAAFTAVRGNGASNIQIVGNNCSALDETGLYAEFGFEGAIIANNIVDGAENGISVTNFNEGGRLATVSGNIVRDARVRRAGVDPESGGIGIGVEADTAVTGNVVENAQTFGIGVGWGPYLRDVTVTGNVVRDSGIGVAVSVVAGPGAATIADNLIAGSKRGAIVGMERAKPLTGDLALAGAERYPQLTIANNRTR